MTQFISKINYYRRYNRIEIFGICFSVLFIVLFSCGFYINHYYMDLQNDILDSTAVYTETFSYGTKENDTLVSGKVKNLYINKDKTKCVLMYKYNDDCMDNVSLDASMYHLYITGYNVSRSKMVNAEHQSMTGGIYIFGGTGYAMIYLIDNEGFANQALQLVLRCNETMYDTTETDEDVYTDIKLYINPSGSNATTVDFLDDFDITTIYQAVIIDESEGEIRDTLINDVETLRNYDLDIQKAEASLTANGIVVPERPEAISGDTFEYISDENGNKTLIYKPNYIFKNGTDYYWFESTLATDRYLEQVQGTRTALQYFEFLKTAEEKNGSYTSVDTFKYTSGETVDTESETSVAKSASTAIDAYNTAISEYYDLKYTYQTSDLIDYLKLENDMLTTSGLFSSNYDENAITVLKVN